VDGGAGAELQQAAGVGGDDGLRAGGLGVAHFLGQQWEHACPRNRNGERDFLACGTLPTGWRLNAARQ
jgi:hypothetical protein